MEAHIKAIKKQQKGNESKDVYGGSLDSCLATVDRLVKVKSAQSDAYYKCIAGLNESIIKGKLAEKAEEGLEFDNGIYAKNQKTVADLLSGNKMSACRTGISAAVPCKAIDLITNQEHSYSSITEFLSEAGLSMNDLSSEAIRKPNPDGTVTIGNWKYLGPSTDIKIVNEF